MNEQNSSLKIIGPAIGFIILGYVIYFGINQFNEDRTSLSERPSAALASVEVLSDDAVASDAESETDDVADEESAESSEAAAEASTDSETEAVASEEKEGDEATDEEVAVQEAEGETEATETEATETEATETEATETEATETTDAAAAGSADSVAIAVQTGDLFFGEGGNNLVDPPVWTVGSGQEIVLTFDNMGGVQHNWAVLNQGVEDVPIPFFEDENAELLFYNPGLQDAGAQFEDTFTAPTELGEYLVICTAPGHYPLMQGRLVVE